MSQSNRLAKSLGGARDECSLVSEFHTHTPPLPATYVLSRSAFATMASVTAFHSRSGVIRCIQ